MQSWGVRLAVFGRQGKLCTTPLTLKSPKSVWASTRWSSTYIRTSRLRATPSTGRSAMKLTHDPRISISFTEGRGGESRGPLGRAFTLLELLVVIAVIALLSGLVI